MEYGERKGWKIQKRAREEVVRRCIMCLNGFPEGKERKNRADAMCEVIMAENFPIHQTDEWFFNSEIMKKSCKPQVW